MLCAVLRISSDKFNPNEFISKYGFETDAIFENGLNLSVSDVEDQKKAFAEIYTFIKTNAAAFDELKNKGIESELDVAFDVGTDEQFTCSVTLDLELMALLQKYNIVYTVSSYPACD